MHFSKEENSLPRDAAISPVYAIEEILFMCMKEMYTKMLTAALLVTAKNW